MKTRIRSHISITRQNKIWWTYLDNKHRPKNHGTVYEPRYHLLLDKLCKKDITLKCMAELRDGLTGEKL